MQPNVELHIGSVPRPDVRSVDDQNKIALILSILLGQVGTGLIHLPQPQPYAFSTQDYLEGIAHPTNPPSEPETPAAPHFFGLSDNEMEDVTLPMHSAHDQHVGDEGVPLLLNQFFSSARLRSSPQQMPGHFNEDDNDTDAFQSATHLTENSLGWRREFSNSTGEKPSKGNRKALLIGITYMQKEIPERSLLMPWKDVEQMKQLLIGLYHYDENDIVIMTDEPSTPEHLQPERANIVREINSLVQNPGDGDDFFFYYAGHATQRTERIRGNERDHMDECLIPLDAMTSEGEINSLLIVDDDLHSTLIQPLIQAQVDCQLIAVMDTCTSGTILDLRHDQCNEFRLRNLRKNHWHKIREVITGPTGHFCTTNCNEMEEDIKASIVCLSACRDSQSIVEYQDGVTLAGALDDYLRGKNCPPLGKLFPELRDKIKLNHQILRAAEKFRCNKNGRERRIPTKSPSLQVNVFYHAYT
ncbi:hypothetical protein AGABI2DRAFT_123062 [Agaricus bisporus var. bisporus H97]|uniref:hypothetical protein n=1 Tax=Agaricus bisporus var. bisporus (strain H97 / ATCC MYA-4626 / FGSC 10389) TaxID=936046 RepID=UPI00029F6CC7|nr:hypothetical protein AGABI2DRAFT_123062 [Agaricus bisporus var. bisporus H97]EKV41940.1 hypothetical protein AGABI2DRAFT_123062 [Agaricus bisporus var. bisporus H97]